MKHLSPIHPFPARMAPEIAIKELQSGNGAQAVLDPMSGSGTVLRAASELGHEAIGFDLDPLAVLMTRVWTTRLSTMRLLREAEVLLERARHLKNPFLSWIDECQETSKYVAFWFCSKQIEKLRCLSSVLLDKQGVYADAMRIALSRIIITKERGCSVARDTSHSRPHRVFFDNDYDVYAGFLESVRRLANRLAPERIVGKVAVRRGDARRLSAVQSESIDLVITSPPYLNAIDYFRGHRLSLVWLGYNLPRIRAMRTGCIGSEHGPDSDLCARDLLSAAGHISELPTREQGMIRRYANDVHAFVSELTRVTKKGGKVLLVVGNSCLNGVLIRNARINMTAAEMVGLENIRRTDRRLPASRRYLPLPSSNDSGALSGRMRTETVLVFRKL